MCAFSFSVVPLVVFRSFAAILLSCLLCLVLPSCEKYNGEGSVLVKLVYENHPVESAVVYIKYNTTGIANPAGVEYDMQQVVDAKGEVYFNNLPEGNHFVYADGYSNKAGAPIEGTAQLSVAKRYANNGQTLTINVTK